MWPVPISRNAESSDVRVRGHRAKLPPCSNLKALHRHRPPLATKTTNQSIQSLGNKEVKDHQTGLLSTRLRRSAPAYHREVLPLSLFRALAPEFRCFICA